MSRTFFITGTDTGVGKTVLTSLWTAFLRHRHVRVAAFKPLCSGGREDALALHAALGDALSLADVNPWHFHAPLAPVLAARREGKVVTLAQVRAHIQARQKNFDITLVEGAGGLLSPLGKDFDSRDLLLALRAAPIIVAANKLGAVNHILLTLEALPKKQRAQALVVMMSPAKTDVASATNVKLLEQFIPAKRILTFPWLGRKYSTAQVLKQPRVNRLFQKLTALSLA